LLQLETEFSFQVSNFLFILLELYRGLQPAEILALEVDVFLTKLGLDEHLTPQRANGVRAVIERIRTIASALIEA